MRVVPALEPLKPLAIHTGKSEDMGQQRTLGIKPPALHHHTDAVQRQLSKLATLFRLDLSCQPYEALVLPELSFELSASNIEYRRKRTGNDGRALKRRRYAKHRRHLHIHREHLAVPIRHRASGPFEGHSLLMLAISSRREFRSLKYLERDQPK